MLTKSFIEFLYEAAYIQRWNDHIRPGGFTELDKQAHKMMILYVLARHEEDDHGAALDWQVLIEGGIFEFLHRNVLTDIKPPVFHELMRKQGPALNKWVGQELRRRVPDLDAGVLEKLARYFADEGEHKKEKQLLRAAHYLASQWEFEIIYHFNQGIYGIEETKQAIESELEEHFDLAGVQKLALQGKTKKFIDLVGQLRFQKRWAQSPRVPETSVMGHMLIVAVMAYLCALEVGACKERLVNDFLCGLFHDLPEVLTRDIISPVKRSVEGLDDLIKEIEKRMVEDKLLPLLPPAWHQDINYYTRNEFKDKVLIDGKEKLVDTAAINAFYNVDGKGYRPVDGSIIKGCDNLAAFVEVWLSRACGITSKHLLQGEESLRRQYKGKKIGGIDFGALYEQFPPQK